MGQVLDGHGKCGSISPGIPVYSILLKIVGWAGYVKVDGQAYVFLGAPSVAATKATQKSLEVRLSLDTYIKRVFKLKIDRLLLLKAYSFYPQGR